MSLAQISIKRPIFISCIIIIMLAVGLMSMRNLGVDLFPNVTFPVVTITTVYPGAGPNEIETLVTKPIEDEVSTISGMKRLSSINQEGASTVVAEFTLETDIKYAEQQIRDRLGAAKRRLPTDVKEPIVRRIDPSDQPVLMLSVRGDLPPSKLYDVANELIKPRLEQVPQVGLVEVIGGRKREVRVELDRTRLKAHEISASQVVARLAAAGENIPVGKIDEGSKETTFRTLGQFKTLKDIGATIINFYGSDVPTSINDVGRVVDTLADERSQTYIDGERSLFIMAFRQSGANTISVVDALVAKIGVVNKELQNTEGKPEIGIVRDASWWIRVNVADVKETIFIGIALAVLVVFFFLGNARSTFITGLALPNSLIGAFILMAMAGFTINIMTLLALSLAVGLLIDDAIVVRENIFRHIEMGKKPMQAALDGTAEVTLAVIATTLTVIAVFGPIAFLKGVVGQFFKQFGATICFAMAISLFDALTIAPMLSTYFAGDPHAPKKGLWHFISSRPLQAFERFQVWLENGYERIIKAVLKWPLLTLFFSFLVFVGSCASVTKVPKTFLPPQDAAEFALGLDLAPGTSLDKMAEVALAADKIMHTVPEIERTALTVGSREGEPNVAEFYVKLIDAKKRKLNTSDVKEIVREKLKPLQYANPKVKDYDAVGGGQRPFLLNIIAQDQKALEEYSVKLFNKLKENKGLKDPDINYRSGKPEFQIVPDLRKMEMLGISTITLGQELRAQIEGVTPAKFREDGVEYDVRVRVKEDQRNVKTSYNQIYVPNINHNLIKLSDVTQPNETQGPAKIYRQDRGRYLQINADIAPGAGMGNIMDDIDRLLTEKDGPLKLPSGMRYAYVGQAENFKELGENMAMAMGFGVLFIFLVLASLYESFVTPFTIMLALPLAMCGSYVALLITGQSLNIFSMIGIIMLLGVATKNSILLVDYCLQLIQQGLNREEAMIKSGKTRLRPILMTTFALIAGTVPIALGLNEASRQRTSMGIAIIGGLVSSTLLTLIVIPAAFSYIDRFRIWSGGILKKLAGTNSDPA